MNFPPPHARAAGPWRRIRAGVSALAIVWLVSATGPQAAEQFVDGIEDLPLMLGLENVPAPSVAFDTGTGRIVVAFAEDAGPGAMDFSAVVSFYASTMPQLGWTAGARSVDMARWTREGEELILEAVAVGPELVVRFSLSPG